MRIRPDPEPDPDPDPHHCMQGYKIWNLLHMIKNVKTGFLKPFGTRGWNSSFHTPNLMHNIYIYFFYKLFKYNVNIIFNVEYKNCMFI